MVTCGIGILCVQVNNIKRNKNMTYNTLTKSELRQRGWNERLINSYLGEPDDRFRNIYGGTTLLWLKTKVEKAEQQDKVKTWL